MAKYKILDWHGIPSQVRARDEDGRRGVQLSERFQGAIDRAAMGAKLFNEEDYTDGFQWQPEQERAGSAEEVAKSVAAELEEQFDDEKLKALVLQIRQGNKQDK